MLCHAVHLCKGIVVLEHLFYWRSTCTSTRMSSWVLGPSIFMCCYLHDNDKESGHCSCLLAAAVGIWGEPSSSTVLDSLLFHMLVGYIHMCVLCTLKKPGFEVDNVIIHFVMYRKILRSQVGSIHVLCKKIHHRCPSHLCWILLSRSIMRLQV